jgi:hypothetical protein
MPATVTMHMHVIHGRKCVTTIVQPGNTASSHITQLVKANTESLQWPLGIWKPYQVLILSVAIWDVPPLSTSEPMQSCVFSAGAKQGWVGATTRYAK